MKDIRCWVLVTIVVLVVSSLCFPVWGVALEDTTAPTISSGSDVSYVVVDRAVGMFEWIRTLQGVIVNIVIILCVTVVIIRIIGSFYNFAIVDRDNDLEEKQAHYDMMFEMAKFGYEQVPIAAGSEVTIWQKVRVASGMVPFPPTLLQ